MENFIFEKLTVKNEKVLNTLAAFLNKVASYSNHDEAMKMRVYVDLTGDFILCEACSYSLCFFSNAHKAEELRTSPYLPAIVAFSDLREKILSLFNLEPQTA